MAQNNAAPLARLIEQFERLPGIGRKNAQRLAYHILSMTDEQAKEFAQNTELQKQFDYIFYNNYDEASTKELINVLKKLNIN